MESTIYKFDYRPGVIDMKTYQVRDYFQVYHTGVENIILEKPELFSMTNRFDQQRPEQIMYNMFGDENLADLFVALNNQNYLWSTPYGVNDIQTAIDFRMNYVEFLFRKRIQRIPFIEDTNAILDEEEMAKKQECIDSTINHNYTLVPDNENKDCWYYNEVGQIMLERVTEYTRDEDEKQRNVVIPNPDFLSTVQEEVENYFKSRTL